MLLQVVCFRTDIRIWLKRNMQGSVVEHLLQGALLCQISLHSFQVLWNWESCCALVAIMLAYDYCLVYLQVLRTCLLGEVPLPAPSAVLALGDPFLLSGTQQGTHTFCCYQELYPRKFFPVCGIKNQFKEFNEDCKGGSRE